MVTRHELVRLARQLGEPAARLAIAGEGNLSARVDGRLTVSASGARLAEADESSFVEIDPAPLLDALLADASDDDWLATSMSSRIDRQAPRPTVEAALHAVVDRACGPVVAAHTHPTAVLAVLCARHGDRFAEHPMFPDQVVLLGERMCTVPYVDPGRALAHRCAEALDRFIDDHGAPPRVLLLDNHGMFVLAPSTRAALDQTMMVVKAAEVFLAAEATGTVVALPPTAVRRIATREDEHYRQSLLAADD